MYVPVFFVCLSLSPSLPGEGDESSITSFVVIIIFGGLSITTAIALAKFQAVTNLSLSGNRISWAVSQCVYKSVIIGFGVTGILLIGLGIWLAVSHRQCKGVIIITGAVLASVFVVSIVSLCFCWRHKADNSTGIAGGGRNLVDGEDNGGILLNAKKDQDKENANRVVQNGVNKNGSV